MALSLRTKLLLTACLLLAVPVAGYRFVDGAERWLRAQQSLLALDAARVLAVALENHSEPVTPPPVDEAGPVLHALTLAEAPGVDAYPGDWGAHAGTAATPPWLRAGHHGSALYLLAALPRGSGTRLLIEDRPLFRRAWWLPDAVPGPQALAEVPPTEGSVRPAHRDPRLRGAVRHQGDTTYVELRVPRGLLGDGLALEVLTAAAAGDSHALRARLPEHGFYRVLLPPARLGPLLARLAAAAGARVRVTDARGRVLAEHGWPAPPGAPRGLAGLIERRVVADEEALLEHTPGIETLEGRELASALAGTPATRLRRSGTGGALVVSAAWPLHRAGQVTGALILEQSASPLRTLGRQALFELFLATAVAFLAGSAALLAVAGRAVARLRRLRDAAAEAIDESGRVRVPFRAPAGSDEIGDLGRSFEAAVGRLNGYQEYLELLAGRLSHEIRTPLAVIRSSLEAHSLGDGGHDAAYLERARLGVERLDHLVRRMSEAARLEQALAGTERGRLDLGALVEAVAVSHRVDWVRPGLRARRPEETVEVQGSADLLVQALDKLLANARDFAAEDSDVVVGLVSGPGHARLFVENQGSTLPEGDSERLFESMVSVREGRDHEPHLGLGLYVVRLVAKFHGGRPFAEDLPGGRGVRIGLELPLAPRTRGV
jgi:signal transduction histidine kinase